MPVKQRKKPDHFQIKISLIDSPVPIWRRLVIDAWMPLSVVHEALQITMGWWSYHLYEFESNGVRYGDMRHSQDDPDLQNADTTDLSQLLKKEGDTLIYLYDHGDEWRHEITLEQIIAPADQEEALSAYCTHGKRACPPEDCGGIPGFTNLLTAVEDPCHPSHEEVMLWTGQSYDPNAFDARLVNLRLELWEEELDAEVEQVLGDKELLSRIVKNEKASVSAKSPAKAKEKTTAKKKTTKK